jgi:glycosyltransferase involved in cell wall biosynthesis
MAAAKRSGTAVKIVSKRALCRYKEEHPVYSFFEDLANLSADAIMVNSRAVAEDVRRTERFLDGKIFLVYNGIEAGDEAPAGGPAPPPADLGLPADALPVTYVANIREDKAHLCLVEAAREVAAASPSVRFLLVGREGKEAEEVRRRIGESGLSDRVLLTGPRRDVPEILRASRLVAHPGEQEGFSNAILEAMAAGVPVVASNAGGNPEAVADGETGFLFPAGDAKALAASILRLLRDPARALAMGKAGRQRVREHFPVGKMVDEVERSYLELLEGRPLSCRL